jgi:hypothetical protein
LEHALGEIEKSHGKGSILRLGSHAPVVPVSAISTGSISVDAALGVGGLPRGRVVEIYGPESSGKTTLALSALAHAQKDGGMAAFIDAEHALDPIYAAKLGVDVDNLLLSQPDSGARQRPDRVGHRGLRRAGPHRDLHRRLRERRHLRLVDDRALSGSGGVGVAHRLEPQFS